MKKFNDLLLTVGFISMFAGSFCFLGYMAKNSPQTQKGIQRIVLGN